MTKIGFLGPKGTFTEKAIQYYISHEDKNGIAQDTPSIINLFDQLKTGVLDKIIVPIENSIEGSVNVTMDLLSKSEGVFINSEIILPIKQCLLSNTSLKLDEIEHIVSHPQAIAQCRDFCHKNLPNTQTHEAPSTAVAAEWLVKGVLAEQHSSKKIAVIGNVDLVETYNLNLIASEINDNKNNHTRFIVLSKTQCAPAKDMKTSLIVSAIKDRPGGLVELLNEFSSRNINLSRIVSRPTQNVLGEYLFFIDCDGSLSEPHIKEAVDSVKKNASYFKLLGSFKQAEG